LATAGVVVTGHGFRRYRRDQHVVELWHGFPLKGLGFQDRHENGVARSWTSAVGDWPGVDLVAGSSVLYNTVMAACFGIPWTKFRTTGFPRTDWFVGGSPRLLLEQVLEILLGDDRLILMAPTFRRGYRDRVEGDRDSGNLLGYPRFDQDRFRLFLERNRLRVIVKLHPFEERQGTGAPPGSTESRVHHLTGRALEDRGIDLYQVIAAADVLCTDYSSITFDFLLLDRPIVFALPDRDAYAQSRGFLLEPLSDWLPGDIVEDQSAWEAAILRGLEDPSHRREDRQRVCRAVQAFPAGGASSRVWEAIERSLPNRTAKTRPTCCR